MKKLIAIALLIAFVTVSCGSVVVPTDSKGKLGRIPTQGVFGGVCAGWTYWTEIGG
jgi:uncharacterized protein YceK